MNDVTVRELRHRSARVLRRVGRGESLTITRDGEPVATLSPLPRPASRVEELIAHRQSLPGIDAGELRADVDALIDPAL